MRVRDEAYEEEDDKKRAPRRLTRLLYKLDNVGWTTDRRKHIFVVGLEGGEPRQLTDGDCEDGEPSWSPDGKQIVFSSLRGDRWDIDLITRVYVVDADGGEPRQLTGDEGSYTMPVTSPDGSRIAYRFQVEDGTFPHHGQIGVMNADGSGATLLTTSLDRQVNAFTEIREPIWDGDRIVFTVEDGGNLHLYSVAADGSSAPQLLAGGEQWIGGYDARGGEIAYVSTTPTTMRELFAGTDGRRLTDVGRAFTEGRTLVEPERYTAVSRDGTEVDAWLVRPVGFEAGKRYPVLLTIHGGPFTQYGTGFFDEFARYQDKMKEYEYTSKKVSTEYIDPDKKRALATQKPVTQYGTVFFDEFQVYAAPGYAVLFSNPRGGSGYSEEWGRAIRGPIDGSGPGWGTVDYEDVTAVVDTALDRFDFLDAERLGVLGGSYGGFMTSWIVSHTNRFKAAVSERAVNHMVSAFGSSDIFWIFEDQFGGPMYDNVDTWLAYSPATYAKDIETPLLILHSENDLRCNIEQGEHLFTLLRLLGKTVEMLRFPAEGHELSRAGSPLHRVQRFEAILEWFGRYLSPGD
jgi:dipeptidyl aminopeptidase/acylaminoacyl peptidase